MGKSNYQKNPPTSYVSEAEVTLTYPYSHQEMVERAIKRVDVQVFDLICAKYNFNSEDLARFLGITERTVRNYRDQNKKFTPEHSEKLLKITRLMIRGIEVFGSLEATHRWLGKPAYAFNGILPHSLLVTSEGINLVADEIDRIAYGELA